MIKLTPILFVGIMSAAAVLRADGPYRNRDNANPNDSGDPGYPVPYQLPTAQEITATLGRVRDHLLNVVPTRVIDVRSGREITDFSQLVDTAALDRGSE